MSTVCHPRCYWFAKADWTRCGLRLGRRNDLLDVIPVEMLVSIPGLCGIVLGWVDYETVVGMNELGLVNGMIPRTRSPSWLSPSRSTLTTAVGIVVGMTKRCRVVE